MRFQERLGQFPGMIYVTAVPEDVFLSYPDDRASQKLGVDDLMVIHFRLGGRGGLLCYRRLYKFGPQPLNDILMCLDVHPLFL